MSDAGSSLPPISGLGHSAVTKPDQAVRIEAVRGGAVGDPSRTTRAKGEVVAVSKDERTATIRIENGNEIDIALRGRMTLTEGQRVELDLPPGQPPQQAVLRPAVSTPPVVTIPAQPVPNAAPASVQIIAQDAIEPPVYNQVLLPPELHEAIDIADRLNPRPVRIAPVPLPPEAIVRLLPLPAGMPPLLPAPESVPVALLPAAFNIDAFRLIPPTEIIHPASAAPQITPSAGPLPSSFFPVQPILNLPAELIRIEMPTLAGELKVLPLPQQAAIETLKILIQSDILLPQEHPLPFIQPINSKLFPVPPVTELQGDIKSLAAVIRAPSAFITDLLPPAATEPVRFDAAIRNINPGLSIQIVPDGNNEIKNSLDIRISPIDTHPAKGSIEARVIATSTQHYPVLSVSMPGKDEPDLFLLQFPASNLPAGTELRLIPQAPAAIHQTAPLPAVATPAFDLMTGWTWPVFEDAIEYYAQTAQPQAAQALANILPNAANAKQLPPAMMFLMAAIQAGDLSGWMGEKSIQALRRDGGRGAEILSRLTRDFAGLSRMSSEPVSQDWRAMAIPLMWQNDIQKIHLYYRQQHGEKDNAAEMPGERSTRFIFDLHLTQMGEIQLDGLMKARRLDLILRTRTPLSHRMQTSMRAKYLDVLDTGRLTGDLAFQNRVDQWVTVETRSEGWATSA